MGRVGSRGASEGRVLTGTVSSRRQTLLLVLAAWLSVWGSSCGDCGDREAPPERGGSDPGGAIDDGGAASVRDGAGDALAAGAVAPDSAPQRTITVAVISDLNGAYGSTEHGPAVHAAVDRIIGLSPDLVLSTGDMVAGQQGGLDHGAMWAGFHRAVTDRLSAASIPFAVTPGNHDGAGSARFAGERAVFVAQWSARRPAVTMVDDEDYPVRYAFAVGPALFLSVDASTVGPLGAEQMRWLDERLSTAGRHTVRVVFGHLPLHPVAVGRETEVIGDPALERLLVRHDVDLYVAGHHHAFYPARRGALRLLSVGCLGSGPRALIGSTEPSPQSFVVVEVGAEGVRSVEAHVGRRFEDLLDRATLPESIGEGEARLGRDDLGSTAAARP